MKIHEVVKKARLKKGLSQIKLSEKTGVRIAAICEFERGQKSLTTKSLELIFSELGLFVAEKEQDE